MRNSPAWQLGGTGLHRMLHHRRINAHGPRRDVLLGKAKRLDNVIPDRTLRLG
jgi:hypothetical protein